MMAKKINHVSICGAFGGVNIGDEAIAQTMRTAIAGVFTEADISLICTVKRIILVQSGYSMPNTRIASRQDWGSVLPMLAQGPLVIGGGQMLNGGRWAKGLAYLLLIAVIARLFGNKVYILGVGTRAIEKFALSRWIMRNLARTASILRVRDAQSRAALLACGVADRQIEVTGDVVFSGVIAPTGQTAPRSGALFAVHHSPLVKHYSAQDFANFVKQAARARGEGEVRLLCHDIRAGFDLDFARDVVAIIEADPGMKATIIAPNSVAEAMSIYTRTELIISSRMHPLIMGLVAGAQVLALGGAGKVRDLTQRFGAFDPLSITASADAVALALCPLAQGGQVLSGVPDDWRAAARANFDGLAP